MNNIMKAKSLILLNSLFFLLFIGSGISCSGKKVGDKETNNTEKVTTKKKFVCSMHPQIVQDKPGDCPICGMYLIEKLVDNNQADSVLNDVVLPVNESVLSAITTVNPIQKNLPMVIQAPGIINYDTRKIKMISARFAGVIEKSYVKSQFQRIRKGQKIFDIYCPNIYAEHWNYIKMVQIYPDQDELTVEAREWLRLLGHTKEQIESIKRSVKPNYHLAVYSDADGYAVNADFNPEKYFQSENREGAAVTNQTGYNGVGLNDGMSVEIGTPLFKVVDVKSLRADVKVKTEEIGLVKKGQKVIFTVDALNGRKFEAAISQIEPLNGGIFQFVKVFFVDNKGNLFPGRRIQADILIGKRKSTWLPETTVFDMGQHQSVFVKSEKKFVATVIKTGMRSGDNIEILSGLKPNSEVALNASLLIDSDGLLKQ
jgi:Cu(I)/Ag(I) efflux system membrane fusion protein